MGFLLALSGGFASGVLLQSLFPIGWGPTGFVFLLALLFAGARFTTPRLAYTLGALFFLCVALGMLRTTLTDAPLPQSFASHLKHRVSYTGIVVADPDVRDTSGRTEVRVSNGTDTTTVLVVAPRTEVAAVGDTVHVSGTLLLPEPFTGDNGRVFRYDKYLARDGVQFILSYGSLYTTRPAPWYSLPALFARIKHSFLDGLNAVLPEPYSSLGGGIVIGGKSGLGQDLQDAFTRSGLVQIIVLSGYNIMVVAEWIFALLARTKLPRAWGAGAGAFAILLFVGIAGASATALRAMLMAFIALYARATGRSYAASRALLLVVLLMLIWNPLYLAFDPGFDLSVVATAGLIWLAPRIEHWLAFLKNTLLRNVVATTLAAQIAVLPLLLYFTGNLSLVAIPANIIVDPIVPFAMGFSAFAGFAGMLFGGTAQFIGILFALPAYVATAFILWVAQNAAAFPAAAFMIPMFPWWLVVCAYAALAVTLIQTKFRNKIQQNYA